MSEPPQTPTQDPVLPEAPPLVQVHEPVTRPHVSFARRAERVLNVLDILASVFLLTAAALALLIAALLVNGQGEWARSSLLVGGFTFSLTLGATLMLLARYNAPGTGWLGLLLAVFLINAGLLLGLLSLWLHFSVKTLLVTSITHMTPGPGIYLLVLSVIHLLVANMYFISHNRTLLAEQLKPEGTVKGTKKASISYIPHCWEMYACPEAARSKCPNYLDKVNCWKRRRGCMCDHKLSTYLFHGPAAQDAFKLANPHRLDLAQFADLEHYPAKMREAKPRSWRERRPFCHNCAIFLEHQSIKYRRFNWVFVPISLVLVIVLYPYYHVAYGFIARALDQLSVRLAESGHLPQNFYGNAAGLADSSYQYVLLFVLALLLMSYVVEFTDWCLLEWKV